MKEQSKRLLLYLLNPKAILFGFVLFNCVWMWMRESRIEWEYTDYHGYYGNTYRVMLLLLASLGLLLNRWWSRFITLALSGWVLYTLVILPLQSSQLAHGVSPLSSFALRNWWGLMYESQPQYIIHIAIALVIFIYAASILAKWAYCYATESNKSFDRTRS